MRSGQQEELYRRWIVDKEDENLLHQVLLLACRSGHGFSLDQVINLLPFVYDGDGLDDDVYLHFSKSVDESYSNARKITMSDEDFDRMIESYAKKEHADDRAIVMLALIGLSIRYPIDVYRCLYDNKLISAELFGMVCDVVLNDGNYEINWRNHAVNSSFVFIPLYIWFIEEYVRLFLNCSDNLFFEVNASRSMHMLRFINAPASLMIPLIQRCMDIHVSSPRNEDRRGLIRPLFFVSAALWIEENARDCRDLFDDLVRFSLVENNNDFLRLVPFIFQKMGMKSQGLRDLFENLLRRSDDEIVIRTVIAIGRLRMVEMIRNLIEILETFEFDDWTVPFTQEDQELVCKTLDALGEMGPAAYEAIPSIEAVDRRSFIIGQSVTSALRAIRGEEYFF